jgi:hypothetical protein
MPYWGHGRLDVETLRAVAIGAGKALVDVSHLQNWMILPPMLGLGTFVVLHGRSGVRSRHGGTLLLACICWFTGLGMFMSWWNAGNLESWIVAWVPLLLSVAIVETESARSMQPWQKRLAWAGAFVCLGFMVSADLAALRQDRRPHWAREAALTLQDLAGDGDLVIAVDTEKGAYYDLYLHGRGIRVEPINLGLALEASRLEGASSFTGSLVRCIREHVLQVQAGGGSAFVDRWVMQGAISPVRNLRDIDLVEFERLMQQNFAMRPVGGTGRHLIFEIEPVQHPSALF